MMTCVTCLRKFNDQREAEQSICPRGGTHTLQEVLNGTRNPDTNEPADFLSVDENDLRKWADAAKKLYDI